MPAVATGDRREHGSGHAGPGCHGASAEEGRPGGSARAVARRLSCLVRLEEVQRVSLTVDECLSQTGSTDADDGRRRRTGRCRSGRRRSWIRSRCRRNTQRRAGRRLPRPRPADPRRTSRGMPAGRWLAERADRRRDLWCVECHKTCRRGPLTTSGFALSAATARVPSSSTLHSLAMPLGLGRPRNRSGRSRSSDRPA